MKLEKILDSTNVASDLDEQEVAQIGNKVVSEFELDCESRHEWFLRSQEYFKLALQLSREKTFPWPGASNVQFPLLTVAALQFQARAYPSLLPNDGNIVKARVVGSVPGSADIAIRVGKHMSYQLMEEMDDWEEGMDKMLLALPIVGSLFKKTYYSPAKQRNCSDVVYPKDLVVNYYANSLKDATRISHVLKLTPNQIKERQLAGLFLDVDLGDNVLNNSDAESIVMAQGLHEPSEDEDAPRTIIEQHRYLDLDEDGYKEPYIVSVDLASKKVLRIVPRFTIGMVQYDETGKKVISIQPQQYFTKFTFIPNPDGGFYDLGFGVLLGPINHTVNTLINQLIDAGTLSNLQSGFIGRGVRLRGGETSFRPGEWKMVNATGDDLRKSIFPMPVREPSTVLFNLLGMLITAGKELSTISEIMVGKTPGQNTPATTTMAAVEQGMKVFTAIYKRIYRALKEEFEKLFALNKEHMPNFSDFSPPDNPNVGMSISIEDYRNPNVKIIPGADAAVSSEQQRLAKAQALMEMFPVLPNKGEVIKRVLIAQEQEDFEVLLQQPGPPPPSEQELEHQREMAKLQIESKRAEDEGALKQAQATLAQVQAQVAALQAQLAVTQQQFDQDHKSATLINQTHAQREQANQNREKQRDAKDATLLGTLSKHVEGQENRKAKAEQTQRSNKN